MIKQYMEKLDFPKEATDELYECYRKMIRSEGVPDLMDEVIDQIFHGTDRSFTEGLAEISRKADINEYQSNAVVLLCCIPQLKQMYDDRGIGEDILWDTMTDIRCKLYECKAVKGVWGNFVAYWYDVFFRLRCFKLGRLEFERKPFPLESYGEFLKQGDLALNCHIPSAGPLKIEDVYDSLRRAYEFFPELRKGDILPIYCHSWLLDPEYKKDVFPVGTNTRDFMDLFHIVQRTDNQNYADLWRVFNVCYTEGCLEALPEDTSMRKRLKRHLLAGNKMGDGYGIILFDGERIVNRQSM